MKFEDIPAGAEIVYTTFDSFFYPELFTWQKLKTGRYVPFQRIRTEEVDMWS